MTKVEQGVLIAGGVTFAAVLAALAMRGSVTNSEPVQKEIASSSVLPCLPAEPDEAHVLKTVGELQKVFPCLGFNWWMSETPLQINPNGKGEFETVAEYKARTTERQPKRYAFLLGRDNLDFQVPYNADLGAFEIPLPTEEVFIKGYPDMVPFRAYVLSRSPNVRTMPGFERPLQEEWLGVAVHDPKSKDRPFQPVPSRPPISFPMPRDLARNASGHFWRILVASSYVGPDALKLDSVVYNAFDRVRERWEPSGSGEWLRVDRPIELWVVDDREGGRVILKHLLAK